MRATLFLITLFSFQTLFGQNALTEFEDFKGKPSNITSTYYSLKKGNKGDEHKVVTSFIFEHPLRKAHSYADASKNKVEEYGYSGRQLLDINEKDAKGKKIKTTQFYYDEKDRVVRIKVKNANYEILKDEYFVYDENGRIIENKLLGANEKFLKHSKNTYNSAGLKIKMENLSEDGSLSSTYTYTHNSKGQVEKEKFESVSSSFLNRTYSFTYDEQGNLLTTDTGKDMEYRTYEYDETGNWTLQKSWFKNDADNITVVEREIEYMEE